MTLHDHIAAHTKAVARAERKMGDLKSSFYDREGTCCPWCAHPELYGLEETQKVRIENLLRLLKKRNLSSDQALVDKMERLLREYT